MRELNTIYKKRLRQPCSATSIMRNTVFSQWKHHMVSLQRRRGSEWKRASPVNKSTDDANGHQQLERQGEVDFPDEACRLKMEAQETKCFKASCSHQIHVGVPAHLSARRRRWRRCWGSPRSSQVERPRTAGDLLTLLRKEPGSGGHGGPEGRPRRCSQARPDPTWTCMWG